MSNSVQGPRHSYKPGATPFPSSLIDEVMPRLTDTEWRVLCVVVRTTLGWESRSATGRKKRDWLAQGQLKKRTGRASAAVSKAIAGLVQQQLIEIWSEDGRPMLTPASRRALRGRLYYGLAPGALVKVPLDRVRPDDPVRASRMSSESEHHKANITKEILTKRSAGNFTPAGSLSVVPPAVPSAGDHERVSDSACVDVTLRQARAAALSRPEVRRFLRAYCDLFRERFGSEGYPPLDWRGDPPLVQALLSELDYAGLIRRLQQYFGEEAIGSPGDAGLSGFHRWIESRTESALEQNEA